MAEEAEPDELLVSDHMLSLLDDAELEVDRKRRLKVKGVPRELVAHPVSPRL